MASDLVGFSLQRAIQRLEEAADGVDKEGSW
jgi:hypothetical protein